MDQHTFYENNIRMRLVFWKVNIIGPFAPIMKRQRNCVCTNCVVSVRSLKLIRTGNFSEWKYYYKKVIIKVNACLFLSSPNWMKQLIQIIKIYSYMSYLDVVREILVLKLIINSKHSIRSKCFIRHIFRLNESQYLSFMPLLK